MDSRNRDHASLRYRHCFTCVELYNLVPRLVKMTAAYDGEGEELPPGRLMETG